MSTLDLDLGQPGRHMGALHVPWSRERSAYGALVIPVIVLNGAPGPTVLITAGVHGDEYEGQVLVPELARTLDPAALQGRLILVPRANPPAAQAARRTSPVDGGNLARLFPGDPASGLTAAIAAAIAAHLLPRADAVIDLHAGGSSLDYLPCAWGRLPADRTQAGRVLDLLLAFGNGTAAVTVQPAGAGTLVAAALAIGCTAIAAELGGGGTLTPASLAFARRGCHAALAHLGLLPPQPVAAGKAGPRLLAVHPHSVLRSPSDGIFEPVVSLGQTVAAGDPAGWLHDPRHPLDLPRPLLCPAAGLVLCRRVPAACEPGDVLLHLAEPAARDDLLPR